MNPRLEALGAALGAAQAAVARGAGGLGQRAEGVAALSEGFAPWRGESARLSALELGGEKGGGEASAAAVSGALRAWSLECALEANALDVAVGGALQWQQLHVAALKDLLAKRGVLLDELRKEQKTLQLLHANKASGKTGGEAAPPPQKSGGFWDKALKNMSAVANKTNGPTLSVDEQIAKSEGVVAENEKLLEQHARSLVYCELARFDAEHAAFNALWTRRFFNAQKDLASRTISAWDDALDALGEPKDADRPLMAAGLVWDAGDAAAPDKDAAAV